MIYDKSLSRYIPAWVRELLERDRAVHHSKIQEEATNFVVLPIARVGQCLLHKTVEKLCLRLPGPSHGHTSAHVAFVSHMLIICKNWCHTLDVTSRQPHPVPGLEPPAIDSFNLLFNNFLHELLQRNRAKKKEGKKNKHSLHLMLYQWPRKNRLLTKPKNPMTTAFPNLHPDHRLRRVLAWYFHQQRFS